MLGKLVLPSLYENIGTKTGSRKEITVCSKELVETLSWKHLSRCEDEKSMRNEVVASWNGFKSPHHIFHAYILKHL